MESVMMGKSKERDVRGERKFGGLRLVSASLLFPYPLPFTPTYQQ